MDETLSVVEVKEIPSHLKIRRENGSKLESSQGDEWKQAEE